LRAHPPAVSNGTMLARALSHDLPWRPCATFGSTMPDVSVLLAPDARAGSGSKWFIKPLIWLAAATGMLQAGRDSEVRQKTVAVGAVALVSSRRSTGLSWPP